MLKQMPPEESRTRSRTRRAILDAAVRVLSEDRSAPMGRVADAAGVARSTLQRYFADRTALLEALSAYASDRIDEATQRARTEEGPPLEALGRLVQELFDLGDVVMLVSADWEDEQGEPDSATDRALHDLLGRARAAGDLDPRLTDAWIEQLLWATLYTAWTHVRDHDAPKHDSLAACLLSLTKMVRAA
ncbi:MULTISPECIES: helix-turn-helix domain-containing protein [unclassified Streptomyces]|uniref:TetR/AcrR family transcriptional regulator n=1 Tax=unclassified Streptomyces TaxID=2593676 RepID=UPI003327AC6D